VNKSRQVILSICIDCKSLGIKIFCLMIGFTGYFLDDSQATITSLLGQLLNELEQVALQMASATSICLILRSKVAGGIPHQRSQMTARNFA
jgi:endonuclease IV